VLDPADEKLSHGPYPGLKAFIAEGMQGMFDDFQDDVSEEDSGVGYGDYYRWYADAMALQEALGGRGTLTFYEELKTNFEVEVRRLAAFLGVALPQAKLDALEEHVSFDSMVGREVVTMRKGVVGDFAAHLTPRHWEEVDAAFEHRLGGIPALQKLKEWM
jgi:hypothetical protein